MCARSVKIGRETFGSALRVEDWRNCERIQSGCCGQGRDCRRVRRLLSGSIPPAACSWACNGAGYSSGMAIALNGMAIMEERKSRISSRVFAVDGTMCFGSGTLGGGLYGLRDGKAVQLTTANGLADDFILSLCTDDEGAIWVGTSAGVLHRCTSNSIARFDTRTVCRAQVLRR